MQIQGTAAEVVEDVMPMCALELQTQSCKRQLGKVLATRRKRSMECHACTHATWLESFKEKLAANVRVTVAIGAVCAADALLAPIIPGTGPAQQTRVAGARGQMNS